MPADRKPNPKKPRPIPAKNQSSVAKKKEADPNEPFRLHRYLAMCGIASRRKAEEIIAEGRVTVNGELVTEMGVKVTPSDEVKVDGNSVRKAEIRLYLLNKPVGIVTTLNDPQGRRCISDLLPASAGPMKPVGRLDMQSEGLLFLTNDGDLATRLAHPRYGIDKEYIAVLQGIPSDRSLARLERGVHLDGVRTAPSKWEFMGQIKNENQSRVRIILHEGRNRQIRRMAEMVGHQVVSLKRVRIGPYSSKGMAEGEMRLLGQKDIDLLRKIVGLN